MTQPWLVISTCPDCLGDRFELNHLPVHGFQHTLIETKLCSCVSWFGPEEEGEKE